MKSGKIFINGAEYSPKKVLVIAELGTSHGADPVKADEMIDAAAEAGADCVKFQIVYAREILHPNTGEVALPGGKIRLYDRFRELELDISFFAEMKKKAEKKGLIFLCTPFGPQSAADLYSLGPVCVKIASPELNYTRLLKKAASFKLPILLSSGVSKLGDIEEAISVIREASFPAEGAGSATIGGFAPDAGAALPCAGSAIVGADSAAEVSAPTGAENAQAPSICLLHCVTSYPAPETDYNLRVLKSLNAIFGVPVGISDHSMDPCLVPALGTAMGAAVIEKHFCLSRSGGGLDDPIALPPEDFSRMTREIRRAEKAGPDETVSALCRERGRELVERVLGDGVKRLAPSEEANYERTNRSIHALRDIAEGERIERDMIASLRTEKILRPGLAPRWEEGIIGRKARKFIPSGEGLRLEDI